MLRRTSATLFKNLGHINHVGVAVPLTVTLQKAASFYIDSFKTARVSDVRQLPHLGVSLIYVELPQSRLELLHPLGENSPIAGFLKKNPTGGLHHIGFEVVNLKETIDRLRARNIRTLTPEPKMGSHGHPLIFLHPKDCGGMLIELVEVKPKF